MKKLLRSPPVWIVAAVVALLVISGVFTGGGGRKKLRLDDFEKRVAAGQVKTATVADRDGSIEGELKSGTKYRTTYVKDDAPAVMEELRKAEGIQVKVDHQKDPLPPITLAETTWLVRIASSTTEVSTVFGPPAEETSCMTARTATTARTTQITGPRK